MAYPVQMKSHPVEVSRIRDLAAYRVRGEIRSPHEAVILILDDDRRVNWIVEAGHESPEIGQFLVVDNVLKISMVITASQFDSLLVEGEQTRG
jgi:hypothetical protein